ncbi:MAG: hypothetical protein HDR25_04145 [Lachnospiraceae bacterium]|nr:hypothetical protein [Lachnospiraceae bacterium]
MLYRGLVILLCSCLVAASIPQTTFAKESVEIKAERAEMISFDDDGEEKKEDKEENKKEEDPKPDPEPEPKPDPKPDPEPEPEPKPDPEPEPDPEPTPDPEPDPKPDPEPEPDPEPTPDPEPDPKPDPEPEPKPTEPDKEEKPEESKAPQKPDESEEKPKPSETQTEQKPEEDNKKPEPDKIEEIKKEKETKPETAPVPTSVEAVSEQETDTEKNKEKDEDEKNSKTIKAGQTTDITLRASNAAEQLFKFTASSAGYYNFFVDGANVDGVTNTIYDSASKKNQIRQRTYRDNVRYFLLYLEKGQSVYPAICLSDDAAADKSIKFGVKKASVASVSETDGGYTASTSAITANIGWKPASRTVSTDITLSDKSGAGLNETYIWQIVYGNGDVGYQYAEETISPNVKKEKGINGLTSSQEYSFTMYLLNSGTKALEAVLVSDSNAIKLQTGASRENVIFRGTSSTYESITISVEAVDPVTRVHYGPLGEYEQEVSLSKYISGLGQISVSGLEPATTYYFEFYNASGVVTAYTTVDTKEYPAKVTYAVKATGPDSISIEADIASYTGKVPSSFNLCYEVLDEDLKSVASGMEKVDTKGLEKWVIKAIVDDLEASKQYTVRAWINEPGYTGHFKETARTITTDKPPFPESALKVQIVKNKTKSNTADYTITIEDYLKTVNGKLKYRMKDSLGEYEVINLSVRKGKTTGTLKNLQEGAVYEYEVRLSGVVKRGTFQIGTAAITPELSDDTGAYDTIVSYRLNSAQLQKNTAYSVKLYYYNSETKLYADATGKTNLTAAQDYTVSVQAADFMMLSPNTQYGFKWELYTGSTLSHTIYQLVTTGTSEVSVEITGVTADAITYSIGIGGRTENISNDITLFTYLCPEGGEYQKWGDSFNLYKSKGYKTENRTLAALDDKTTYTISFRDIKGGEYGTFTFTFDAKIDGVRMGVTSLTAGAHNFIVQASIEGETDFDNQYAVLFFKEKNEEDWDIRSSLLEKGQTECGFELTSYLSDDLNADTIYEFVVGVSDIAFPTASDKLQGTYSGEVLTQADARGLTNVSANSGYSYISLKAALTNNPINTTSYIYVFYCESTSDKWTKSDESFLISGTTGGILTFIKDLKPATEYYYIVAVSDNGYDASLSEIDEEMQQFGTITTKGVDLSLEITADEANSTAGREQLTIKATGAQDIKNLKAEITLSSDQANQTFVEETELSSANDYTADVCFEGLSPETTYTVTGVSFKVMETVIGGCYAGEAAYLEPQYSFTTKSAQLPESISIPQTQNIQTDTSVRLAAQVLPDTASQDIVWKSSDESVATVDKDGTVSAISQGEAIITAVSAYSEEISAQCNVCVKSYAAVEKGLDGSLGKEIKNIELYKGYTRDIAFCEVLPDGTLTELTDYEAASDKQTVAELSGGAIKGMGVGRTGIMLKKDGIAIPVAVRVTAAPERFEITGLYAKDARYPAIKKDDTYEIALKDGICYEINGAIIPSERFDAQRFQWSSSNTDVIEINDRGVINPVGAGVATVTVTPIAEYGILAGQQATCQIRVKPVPEKKTSEIVVNDTKKKLKLKEIALAEYLGAGWEWKNPETTVYKLTESAEPYTFEVVSTGDAYYTDKSSIKVYYGADKLKEGNEADSDADLTQQTVTASGDTPKVSKKRITVNTAYNYKDSHDKELLAKQYGAIEIAAGEGQYIKSVELLDNDAQKPSESFEICGYGAQGYLVRPVSNVSKGTYRCNLKVTTYHTDESYVYPLKVKVVHKNAKKTEPAVIAAETAVNTNTKVGSLGGSVERTTPVITNVKPSVSADKNSIVFNTAYSDKAVVTLLPKNCEEAVLSDVVIEGTDKKSQQLMEENQIVLVHEGHQVTVSITGSEALKAKAGTYRYRLTPYYTENTSGEKKALKTLTLKVKMINGTVRANTEKKASTDDIVSVTTDFTKLGDSHRVKGARLVGAYSSCFALQRIGYDMSIINPEFYVKETQPEMLQSGKSYKMSVIYTIETGAGETYEVNGGSIRIKHL